MSDKRKKVVVTMEDKFCAIKWLDSEKSGKNALELKAGKSIVGN